MTGDRFEPEHAHISWCPGCGNFSLLESLKAGLSAAGVDPVSLVIVSGIGQAGKTPHYLKCNLFNGLHGRAIPLATGLKAVNPGLTVIAQGGDGDMYGEGGNHLLHAARRNPDITVLVHNNMVYGLTKGQASPTSQRGFTTALQHHGVISEPLNPMALSISAGVTFVARAFAGDKDATADVIREAVGHKGFALVDIFQPCVTFNKVNTFQWFKDHIEPISDSHDPGDRIAALELAFAVDRLPVGILYRDENRTTFGENLPVYDKSSEPLHGRDVEKEELKALLDTLR